MFTQNKILVITGGTGSFGNAVLRRFLDSDIKEIRIFSRDEKKQDDMRKAFNNRHKAYKGSVLHFMRALSKKQLEEDSKKPSSKYVVRNISDNEFKVINSQVETTYVKSKFTDVVWDERPYEVEVDWNTYTYNRFYRTLFE